MSSPAPLGQPMVTANDHGAIISIAVYFLMTTFIIAVLIRLVIRLAITRSLRRDDYVVVAATFLGVGQSIALMRGVHNGLGKKEDLLSSVQVADVQKAQYASDILYLASLCLAKLSILLLLERLAVSRSHKRITLATAGIVCLWGTVGIVVLAAQCGSSSPWASTPPRCINLRAFWIGMAPVDVITELVVVVIPVLMMIPVRFALSKKAVVVAAFTFRILSIVATITRLFYIHPATIRSPDATFNAVNYNIVTECVLSTCIVTACIPCFKPFLDSFESGFMGISFKDRMPGGSHSLSRNRDYRISDLPYAHTASRNKASNLDSMAIRSQNYKKDSISHSDESGHDARHKIGVSAQVVSGSQNHEQRTPRHHRGGDSSSLASSSRSDEMIIKKNLQYTVQYEEAAPARRQERSSSRRHSAQMRDDKSDVDTNLGHVVVPDGVDTRPGYAV